jgi:hypothetical protein
MLVFRIAVTGAAAPSCLAQQTTVSDVELGVIGHDFTPRHTYPLGDGSRVTHNLYIVLDADLDDLEVTTQVGKQSVTRMLGGVRSDA